MSALGDDLPGELLVGDASLRRFLDTRLNPASCVDSTEWPAAYATLAAQAMDGVLPGSSAVGALALWHAAARHVRISPGFRALCADNAAALERAIGLA